MLVLGALADYLLSLALCTVGVEKTLLAHALDHIACRRDARRLQRADLKTLKHARLDNSCETELRKLIAVELLIRDDFAIDVLDPVQRRDLYDLLLERYRTGSDRRHDGHGQRRGHDATTGSGLAGVVKSRRRRRGQSSRDDDDGVRSRRRRQEDQVLPV